jgi:transposase-like protein
VFGILKRGGRVYTTMLPNVSRNTLVPIINTKVTLDSVVYTDGYFAYDNLDVSGFRHRRINHQQHYADRHGNHINGIENFWNQAKRHLRKYNGIPKYQLPSLPQRVRMALQLRLTCKALFNSQDLDQARQSLGFPRTAPFFIPRLSAPQARAEGNAYVKGLKRRGYASCVVQLLAPSASRIALARREARSHRIATAWCGRRRVLSTVGQMEPVILDLEDLDASPVPVAIDNDDRAVYLARPAAVIAIAIQIDGESDPRTVLGIIDNPVAVDVDACLVAARHPVLCLRRQCESGVSTPLTQQPQHEPEYPPRLH